MSDGIQIGGDGAKIGPGNEFTGKFQGNCVAHSDPLQFYSPSGVNNNIVTGNWFHGNTTGCMCWDGGDNNTFTNNVFESIGYRAIYSGSGENNWLIAHNVFGDDVTMDNGHSAPNGTGNVVRDNVWLPGRDTVTRARGQLRPQPQLRQIGNRQHQRDAGIRCESLVRLLPLSACSLVPGLPRRQ